MLLTSEDEISMGPDKPGSAWFWSFPMEILGSEPFGVPLWVEQRAVEFWQVLTFWSTPTGSLGAWEQGLESRLVTTDGRSAIHTRSHRYTFQHIFTRLLFSSLHHSGAILVFYHSFVRVSPFNNFNCICNKSGCWPVSPFQPPVSHLCHVRP